ncbi:nucleotidyltransferase domain-containing protein [Gracilibacillus halophilus]|nr:nucleotidyltransferase domain-containing protein [Gracilibacillus halophilus]
MNDIYQQLIDRAKSYPEVQKVLLFGSRAYGDNDPRSDIDLAVIAPDITQSDWLKFSTDIENVDTLLKIDLIKWENASDELKNEIRACHRELYHMVT